MYRFTKKLLTVALSAAMLVGSAIPAFAADYTTDGNTTIPISATITGSYQLSLPASIDKIEVDPNGSGNAYIAVPISTTFSRYEKKGIAVICNVINDIGTSLIPIGDYYIANTGMQANDPEHPYEINSEVFLFIGSGTELIEQEYPGQTPSCAITQKTDGFTQFVPSSDATKVYRAVSYRQIAQVPPFSVTNLGIMSNTDTCAGSIYLPLTTTSNALHLDGASVPSPVKYSDMPAGTYSSNLGVSWRSVDIKTDVLK